MEKPKFTHFTDAETSTLELTKQLEESQELEVNTSNQKAIEEKALKILLKIEVQYRHYYEQLTNKMKEQSDVIENLMPLVQNYIVLLETEPKCHNPEAESFYHRRELIKNYHAYETAIRASNFQLEHEVDSLRINYLAFKRCYALLNKSLETSFILGDAQHKPIGYFIELVTDIFEYFHCGILKLNYHADLLDPLDYDALLAYKQLTVRSEEFEEYLMIGLTYCKCLQPKLKCPPPKVPPPKTCVVRYLELPEMVMPLKKRRCMPLRDSSLLQTSMPSVVGFAPSKDKFNVGAPYGSSATLTQPEENQKAYPTV